MKIGIYGWTNFASFNVPSEQEGRVWRSDSFANVRKQLTDHCYVSHDKLDFDEETTPKAQCLEKARLIVCSVMCLPHVSWESLRTTVTQDTHQFELVSC